MQGVAPVNGGGRLADKSALDLPVRMHAVDALFSEPLKASALTLAAPGFSLSFITLASRMTSRMKESLMAHLMHIHWICIARVGKLDGARADVQQHAGEVGGDREQVVLGDGVGLEVVHRAGRVGLDQVERLEDHVLAPHAPGEVGLHVPRGHDLAAVERDTAVADVHLAHGHELGGREDHRLEPHRELRHEAAVDALEVPDALDVLFARLHGDLPREGGAHLGEQLAVGHRDLQVLGFVEVLAQPLAHLGGEILQLHEAVEVVDGVAEVGLGGVHRGDHPAEGTDDVRPEHRGDEHEQRRHDLLGGQLRPWRDVAVANGRDGHHREVDRRRVAHARLDALKVGSPRPVDDHSLERRRGRLAHVPAVAVVAHPAVYRSLVRQRHLGTRREGSK
eukprot:scaffold88048_cov69-Phaeocystis_antarctica.AAC.10